MADGSLPDKAKPSDIKTCPQAKVNAQDKEIKQYPRENQKLIYALIIYGKRMTVQIIQQQYN